MRRIYLTDDSGSWFNQDTAECFKEATHFDGNNQISVNTRTQTEKQALYITAGGSFVLNKYSLWQGTMEEYILITKEEAILWLFLNGEEVRAIELDDAGIIQSYEI